jgi:alkylated DNA repair protein alkB family protein 6
VEKLSKEKEKAGCSTGAVMAAMDFRKMLQEERWAMLQEEAAKRDASKMDQQSVPSRTPSNALQPAPNNSTTPSPKELIFPDYELLPTQLEKVGSINSLRYCEECVDESTETGLLRNIDNQAHQRPWIELRGRKLQCLGNFPHQINRDDSTQLSTEMPQWLAALIDGLVTQGIFTEENRPDNVLINRYEAHEGILHHTDGPAYHDTVAILSLGSDCVLSFRRNLPAEMIGTAFAGDVCSVLLRRRSLLVFEKEAYADFKHGIADEQPVQTLGTLGPCVNHPELGGQEVRLISALSAGLYTSFMVVSALMLFQQVVRSTRTSITFRKLKPLLS